MQNWELNLHCGSENICKETLVDHKFSLSKTSKTCLFYCPPLPNDVNLHVMCAKKSLSLQNEVF